jgi:hypothetical protein
MKQFLILAILFLVACASVPQATEAPDQSAVPVPIATPPSSSSPPAELPSKSNEDDVSPAPASLGITVVNGKTGFLSPMFEEGQKALYEVTIDGTSYIRSYEIIRFYRNADPCIGIERVSKVPGELRTQTMYCENVKYIYVWNEKRGAFNDPQVLGRDSRWEDEAVQGFYVFNFEQLEQVAVPAGKFWTVHKHAFDGSTTSDIWASPEVPGFEAGLVKSVVIEDGKTTVTKLVSFGGMDVS